MKNRGKKRKYNSRPRLTKRDKAIYNILLGLSCAVPIALTFLLIFVRRRIGFSVVGTIAVADPFALLLVLPLFMFLFLSGLIFSISKKQEKVAIFGDKKVKYAWGEEPLFSKHRHPKTPMQKKKQRVAVIAWCSALVVLLLLAFPSIFSRTTLTKELHIQHYNAFNVLAEETPSRFEASEFKIFYVGKGAHWTFSITIQTENGTQEFRRGDFSGSLDEVFEKLFEIVDRSDRFTVKRANRAQSLIEDYKMTPEQSEKLYALLARGAS